MTDEPVNVNVSLADGLELTMRTVSDEIVRRLETPVSERDVLAIVTGVLKAANAGARLGTAQLITALESAGAVPANTAWNFNIEDQDSWAEQYGGGAE